MITNHLYFYKRVLSNVGVYFSNDKKTYIFIKLVKQDEVIEDKNKSKMQFNTKEK